MVYSKERNLSLNWFHARVVEGASIYSTNNWHRQAEVNTRQAGPEEVYILVEETAQTFRAGEATLWKAIALGLGQQQGMKKVYSKRFFGCLSFFRMEGTCSTTAPPALTYDISSPSTHPQRGLQIMYSQVMCFNAKPNEPILTQVPSDGLMNSTESLLPARILWAKNSLAEVVLLWYGEKKKATFLPSPLQFQSHSPCLKQSHWSSRNTKFHVLFSSQRLALPQNQPITETSQAGTSAFARCWLPSGTCHSPLLWFTKAKKKQQHNVPVTWC